MDDLASKENAHSRKLSLTIATTNDLLKNQHNLWKSSQVVDALKLKHDLHVTSAYVASVLRNVMGMRYKRVVKTAIQTNTEASLVKRQASAMVLLTEMQRGKRILNLDESWVGEMDFRKLKWRRRGESNTISSKEVTPRLTLIAAIDNFGGLYFSVVQSNTDGELICAFLSHLVVVLSAEDPDWRANTILLLDNAAYHHTDTVLNQLKLQGIDHIFLGPYGFSSAPIETFFSALKRTQLNPHHQATGKK